MKGNNSEKILLIDKPKGVTSFDVIRVLRRKLGIEKMGHAGTLDPLATGLLIIGVEEGTRELTKLIGLPKKYLAEIALGIKTDTGDLDGKIERTSEPPPLSREEVSRALDSMKGHIDLRVPAYSAVKRAGKPLYQYAREGKKIIPPLKKMEVRTAELKDFKNNIITVEFDVSSGTYIRSLAEELAKRLGTIAALQNLRRTAIGNYSIDQAISLT